MDNFASFRFYGALADFLPFSRRGRWIAYPYKGAPAVKDAVEALGVPHPEVEVMLINGSPVGFSAALRPGDRVEVFPCWPEGDWPEESRIGSDVPEPISFVLDVHLGRLAKALRLLGFDTCYQNDYDDQEIAARAKAENRVVLTRDIGLLKQKAIRWGYWLRSQHLEEQLREVIRRYGLQDKFCPFTRCLACNHPVEAVPKEAVWHRLPPETRLYYHQFFLCRACERVYWKGSHYERMQAFVKKVTQ